MNRRSWGLAFWMALVVGSIMLLHERASQLLTGLSETKIADMAIAMILAYVLGITTIVVCINVAQQIMTKRNSQPKIFQLTTPTPWASSGEVAKLGHKKVFIPHFTINGKDQAFGFQQAEHTEIETRVYNEEGMAQTLSVPLDRLVRFAKLPTPSRSEWVGKATMYSDCAKFFAASGLLEPAKSGGLRWRATAPPERRLRWLEGMQPQD